MLSWLTLVHVSFITYTTSSESCTSSNSWKYFRRRCYWGWDLIEALQFLPRSPGLDLLLVINTQMRCCYFSNCDPVHRKKVAGVHIFFLQRNSLRIWTMRSVRSRWIHHILSGRYQPTKASSTCEGRSTRFEAAGESPQMKETDRISQTSPPTPDPRGEYARSSR